MASPPRDCGRGAASDECREWTWKQAQPSERRYEGAASDGGLFEREPALAVLTSSLDGLGAGRGRPWPWRALTAAARPPCSTPWPELAARARAQGADGHGARARAGARAGRGAPALRGARGRSRRAPSASCSSRRARRGPRCRSSRRGRRRATPRPPASLVHGLYRLTANMAAAGPLVLAIDDATWPTRPRWASSSTWRAASSRCRSADASAAARPWTTWPPTSLDELLGRTPPRVSCRVEPLSGRGTAAWLRASFFPDAHDALLRRVHEAERRQPLARSASSAASCPRRGVDPGAAGATTGARRGARVGGRLRDAPCPRHRAPDAAVLLEAAAVLGPGQPSCATPRALTGLPRQRVAALMDALAAIGVLAGDERLRFVHPVFEAAVHARSPRASAPRPTCGPRGPARTTTRRRRPWSRHLLRAGQGGGDWVTRMLRTAAPRALWPRARPRGRWSCSSAPGRSRRRGPAGPRAARAREGSGDRRGPRGARPPGRGDRAPARGRRAGRRLRSRPGRTLLSLGPSRGRRGGLRARLGRASDGEGEPGRPAPRRERHRRAAPATAGARGSRPPSGARARRHAHQTARCSPSWPSTRRSAGIRTSRCASSPRRALARGALLDDEGARGSSTTWPPRR